MRLEVGYGLEAVLTDASAEILREVVAPRFREGKIADGIAAGLDAIDQVIAGTYKARLPAQAGRARRGPGGLLPASIPCSASPRRLLAIVLSG